MKNPLKPASLLVSAIFMVFVAFLMTTPIVAEAAPSDDDQVIIADVVARYKAIFKVEEISADRLLPNQHAGAGLIEKSAVFLQTADIAALALPVPPQIYQVKDKIARDKLIELSKAAGEWGELERRGMSAVVTGEKLNQKYMGEASNNALKRAYAIAAELLALKTGAP